MVYGIIYKITNKINGKIYIGMTTRSLKKRWAGHKWCSKKDNRPLYVDIRKFYIDNFKIEELESFDDAVSLGKAETKWISFYNSKDFNFGYNISPGNSIIRESTKKKISEALKGKNNPMFGKHLSDEAKKKISEFHSGKINSEETKRKMSQSKIGKNNAMYGKFGEKHPSYGKLISEKTRQKMSKAKIGKVLSEETKLKISKALSGENHPMFGKHHSEETILKMIKSKKCDNAPMAKLNWYDVNEIRENIDNLSREELGKKYNVNQSTIGSIIHNKTWKISEEDFEKYKQPSCKNGENHPCSKLIWSQVEEIRKNINNLSIKELAEIYNVYRTTIKSIINNKTWKVSEKEIEMYKECCKKNEENYYNTKVNLLQVEEIRKNTNNLSQKKLAEKYNVSKKAINDIINKIYF